MPRPERVERAEVDNFPFHILIEQVDAAVARLHTILNRLQSVVGTMGIDVPCPVNQKDGPDPARVSAKAQLHRSITRHGKLVEAIGLYLDEIENEFSVPGDDGPSFWSGPR